MEEDIENSATGTVTSVETKTEEKVTFQTIDARLDKEDVEDIWVGRRRMAWVALWAMIIPTLYIIGWVTNIEFIDKAGDLMSWFYLAMASIVCAYFGFSSWANIKGK